MATATLYRMVTDDHTCPFGLKAKSLLQRRGYDVEDHLLSDRAAQDAFKQEHDVQTTPQIFISGDRVGGYDDLRQFLGIKAKGKDEKTYAPIIAIFSVAALMSLAVAWMAYGAIMSLRVVELFVAISMCILGIQKLRDLNGFTNGFLGYDLLAKRYIPYAYIYPFVEAGAGILMIAGGFAAKAAAPFALVVGSIGAWSVYKAVYIDKRDINCACVGGNSRVPLGAISLTENLMMIGMSIWMIVK